MIKLHYSIANAIDDCIAKLEGGKRLSWVLMKNAHRLDKSIDEDTSESDSGVEEEYESLWYDGKKRSDS
jgi:hypothetical protein